MPHITAQKKANRAQDEKRKSLPVFSQVRFEKDENDDYLAIANTIEKHGGTRKQALIDAFALLDIQLSKNK